MSTSQQTELKLVEVYDQELEDLLGKAIDASRAGKEALKSFLKEVERKINIFEKQVLNYKRLFPNSQDIQSYESRVYFFQGVHKVYSSLYYDMYPGGIFSPSKYGELSAAMKLFDTALQICEQPNARSMKVFCYRQLGDNKNALQELDYILEHYSHDEEVYLKARKEKDELETPASSGIGKFFRSIFG